MLASAVGIDVGNAVDKSGLTRDKCVAMLESCLRVNPHYFKANYWLATMAIDDDPRRACTILTKTFSLTDVRERRIFVIFLFNDEQQTRKLLLWSSLYRVGGEDARRESIKYQHNVDEQ